MARADAFESITENSALVDELRETIRRGGPMTFRDYMEQVLYHPRHGYYRRATAVMTRGGDFVTSPEVHSVFGALVATQLREMWAMMDRPTRFDIVEFGAGTGALARDVLRAIARDAEFARAVRYGIVEVSPALARTQRETLDEFSAAGTVTWPASLPDSLIGCVLSNEFVDAFPVHRVVRHGSDLREVYVTCEDGAFRDELRPLSDDRLGCCFDDLDLLPGEGAYAEVNLEAPRWVRDVAAHIERGYVLTFDYGYEAADLYAPWRRDGTLLCFYRQSASSDPYQRIGMQDMTASVDFTTLRRAGESAGLQTLGMTDQSSFLVRLGIAEGVAAVAGQMEEYFARRKVVMDLIDPARLGRIKVLLQGKGVPEQPLGGFRDSE